LFAAALPRIANGHNMDIAKPAVTANLVRTFGLLVVFLALPDRANGRMVSQAEGRCSGLQRRRQA
jgi:hypothetical protein